MKAEEILAIIKADEEDSDYERVYGIRADHSGTKPGALFDNSREWLQDDPESDYYEYVEARTMWVGEDLCGTCSIGLGETPTIESIEAAIELLRRCYLWGTADTLYLIGGDDGWPGNDPGEMIIENAVCLAVVFE